VVDVKAGLSETIAQKDSVATGDRGATGGEARISETLTNVFTEAFMERGTESSTVSSLRNDDPWI
jgi:hypothetical protein